MKKLLAICLLAAPMFAADAGTLNDGERAFLLEQLQKSKKDFISSLAGISDAQWRFKPALGPSGKAVAVVVPIEVTFRLL